MKSGEIIETIKSILKTRVENHGFSSPEFFDEIRNEVLGIIKLIDPSLNDADTVVANQYYKTALNEFLTVNPIYINPSSSLKRKGVETWLTTERKKSLSTNYIDRYLTSLQKEGRGEKVIYELSRSSEKILGKLGDPTSDQTFYIKGLVVGGVQSGKTGNFNAVINRAIDAGYSLIIVLSGIIEDLRKQTQLRIENDVVGEGTIDIKRSIKGDKGVGIIRKFGEQGGQGIPQVFLITSYTSDFKKSVQEADFSLNNKNILVCKKNTGVLKNLLIWLNEYLKENTDKHNIPLLIVDDEADNASLNNLGYKGKQYASIINGHIRSILGLFAKKTYIGYTATPFAIVLQDRNDVSDMKWKISYRERGVIKEKNFSQVPNLFPDDFIELLDVPSNYIGAKNLFETVFDTEISKIPLVVPVIDSHTSFPLKVYEKNGKINPANQVDIDDEELIIRSSRKDDPFPFDLPESLIEAIQCFVLTIALRLKRRPEMVFSKLYNPHYSMLIHVSRFIMWQNRTKMLVNNYLSSLESEILNDLPSSEKSIFNRLEKIWDKYYASIVRNIRTYLPDEYNDEFLTQVTYMDIRPLLIDAVKGIQVKAINSALKDELIYTEESGRIGQKYIAIGGNRLSRGFTLEGLTINYFIRDTSYSDTLLQMGRWFGYRPGYLDCCKLFTTYDAIDKFDSTTRAIEELETEFNKMVKRNKSPEDFIIRVLKDPGALKITRPSILKNAIEVNWSYQDKLVQTTQFDLSSERIKKSWGDFINIIDRHKNILLPRDGFYTIGTDLDGFIEFLNINNSFHSYSEEFSQIKIFLERCKEKDKLKSWTIAIKTKGEAGILKSIDTGLPNDVQLTLRSGPKADIENTYYRKKFLEEKIFTGSGKSANIVTTGKDFSILLSEKQIKETENKFISDRIKYYVEELNYDFEIASAKARKINKPERIYREVMSDQSGLMIIYLIDTKYVFLQNEGNEDLKMKEFVDRENIDLKIPLIGYAIGFPPISPDPGALYWKGDYDIIEEADEFDDELEIDPEE